MEKSQYEKLNEKQRCSIAAAHLVAHPELQPAGSQPLFEKLSKYDQIAASISGQMDQARDFIKKSEPKLLQLQGSINAMLELISETIDNELIAKCCEEFQPDEEMPTPAVAGKATASEVDMAGATAKTLPPIDTTK